MSLPAIVHVARHATPDWARTDIRYDIPPGPPLVEHGVDEARALGVHLRDSGIARLFHSPLVRTAQTATIAAEVAGLEPVRVDAIAEWRSGESETDVLERFRAFWLEAADISRTAGPVALVTHGGPIRALLAHLGLPERELDHYRGQFDHRNPLPPAGVWTTAEVRDSFQHGVTTWRMALSFAPSPFEAYRAADPQPRLRSETR